MRYRAGVIVGMALALSVPALAQAGSSATINGVVHEMSEDGQSSYPSSGVTVQALWQPDNSIQGTTVTSGSDFSFNVEPGDYHVTYAKEGFGTQCLQATAPVGLTTSMPTTLYRLTHADSASGTVTNSFTGLPIENATVEAYIPFSCAPPAASLSTDANGAYTFAVLPANPSYYFTFSAPGYHTETMENVTVFDSPAQVDAALEAVDSTPPEATIDSVKVKRRKATVKFLTTDPAPATPPLTVTCQLDKEPAEPCEEPKVVYKGLSKGKHKVILVMTDGAANTAKAKAKFKIK
jgi:Carboxypeptidase regulatory-like domain